GRGAPHERASRGGYPAEQPGVPVRTSGSHGVERAGPERPGRHGRERASVNGLHHLFVWFNDPANWQGPRRITHRVAEHMVPWAKAMTIATLLAVPGGLLLGRSRRSGVVTVNVANIGRAIPSFAILSLGVVWFGLSDTPTVVALVLLAVPPMFTFTFTAIR